MSTKRKKTKNAKRPARKAKKPALQTGVPEYLSPVKRVRRERIHVLDVLRGFAIFGILVVNIPYLGGLLYQNQAASSTADNQLLFWMHFLFEGKFYAIFSILFGVGIYIQFENVSHDLTDFSSLMRRRLGWLVLIGLFHGIFLWYGDILLLYAVVGLILYKSVSLTAEKILRKALLWFAVPIGIDTLIWLVFQLIDPAVLGKTEGSARVSFPGISGERLNLVYGHGGILQIILLNANIFVWRVADFIYTSRAFKVGAFFLLGIYAVKSGMLSNLRGNLQKFRRPVLFLTIAGLALNLVYAVMAEHVKSFPPSVYSILKTLLQTFAIPALSLPFIYALVALTESGKLRGVVVGLANTGRLALTNYLLQSLVSMFIFYGIGFKLFGKTHMPQLVIITCAIFLGQIGFSHFWLRSDTMGPVEKLWRRMIYGENRS